ncbi:hypothetical protein [Hahella sp. NBU794]|uniref:hypothetical protein n=1 Tax=Hahella sp. NBU794 TaxID=3422590 RepID=UPI003D6F04BD
MTQSDQLLDALLEAYKEAFAENFSENVILRWGKTDRELGLILPEFDGAEADEAMQTPAIFSARGLQIIIENAGTLYAGNLTPVDAVAESADDAERAFAALGRKLGFPCFRKLAEVDDETYFWIGYDEEKSFPDSDAPWVSAERAEAKAVEYCIRYLEVYFNQQKEILNSHSDSRLTHFNFWMGSFPGIILNEHYDDGFTTSLGQLHSSFLGEYEEVEQTAILNRVLLTLENHPDALKHAVGGCQFEMANVVEECRQFDELARQYVGRPMNEYMDAVVKMAQQNMDDDDEDY